MRIRNRVSQCLAGAFVLVAAGLISAQPMTQQCRMMSVPIPDDGLSLIPPQPATDVMNIAGGGAITDMTVDVVINHTWVGDLIIELEHLTTGTRVILMERPGLATRTGCCGCAEDNIDCTFDDLGARGDVELICDVGMAAAISGAVIPFAPIAGFIGEDIGGDWQLDVFDGAGADTGNLVSWCINYDAGGPQCVINNLPASPTSADISFDVDITSMAVPPDITAFTLEWSVAGAGTFMPCTMAATSPSMNPLIMVPAGNFPFVWDSVADGIGGMAPEMVDLRGTGIDATGMSICTDTLTIDNRVSCTVAAAGVGPYVGAVTLDVTTMTMTMPPTVDVVVEWSPAGMMTFFPCTMTVASPDPNPLLGATAGMHQFIWDSATDGAGIGGPEMIDVQITVIDTIAMQTCLTTITVDNTGPPPCAICGDCNVDGLGPTITDALSAAQISAGILMPSMTQMQCCDVNSSGTIQITDALFIAQDSAGLMVTLICP